MARALSSIEVLLSIILISLVWLSAGLLFRSGAGFYSVISAQADMQNQANFALQHIVRNLVEADGVEILEPSRIEVTQSGATYEYWLDGSEIKCDKDGLEVIASKAENLIFSDYQLNDDTQRVTLAIEVIIQDLGQPLAYSTRATLRRYE